MKKPSKYAKLQYAALVCGEFFRDELQFGNIAHLSPRVAQHMQVLKTTCFDALGDPSVADADAIRRKVSVDAEKSPVLTENNARIAQGEYFDCPNTCNSKTVNWIKGDAYCPECGECGVVYPASVMERVRKLESDIKL